MYLYHYNLAVPCIRFELYVFLPLQFGDSLKPRYLPREIKTVQSSRRYFVLSIYQLRNIIHHHHRAVVVSRRVIIAVRGLPS